MKQFAKQVGAHLVGWVIVRGFLSRLVNHYNHYSESDDWDREKKDIAVKVVAELESVRPGEDLQLHGPAVEKIAEKIFGALEDCSTFSLWWRNKAGAERPVTLKEFTDACRVGFETVIAEARQPQGGMETKGQWGR